MYKIFKSSCSTREVESPASAKLLGAAGENLGLRRNGEAFASMFGSLIAGALSAEHGSKPIDDLQKGCMRGAAIIHIGTMSPARERIY
jgi:hypothetical protein